jgi:hypothetical protein
MKRQLLAAVSCTFIGLGTPGLVIFKCGIQFIYCRRDLAGSSPSLLLLALALLPLL